MSSSSGSSKKITRNTSKKKKSAKLTEFSSEIDQLNKWSILEVSNRDIYKIEFLDLTSLIAIKTLEKTVIVDQTE